MALILRGSVQQVTAAISSFDQTFHLGYFAVRQAATAHLLGKNGRTLHSAENLAYLLRNALREWSMGQQKAPRFTAGGVPAAAAFLKKRAVMLDLLSVADVSVGDLGLDGRKRLGPLGITPDQVDLNYYDSLLSCAAALFAGATNVTYPMKAMLLLTGFMPAFDSQVRGGLARAGFKGLAGNRHLLPRQVNTPIAKKTAALPYWLGQCWKSHMAAFQTAAKASDYPELADEPGRLFDVLLFAQCDTATPLLLEWVDDGQGNWYELS